MFLMFLIIKINGAKSTLGSTGLSLFTQLKALNPIFWNWPWTIIIQAVMLEKRGTDVAEI